MPRTHASVFASIEGSLVRSGIYPISVGVGALVVALALNPGGAHDPTPVNVVQRMEAGGISVIEKSHPSFDVTPETDLTVDSAAERQSKQSVASGELYSPNKEEHSFDERFASAFPDIARTQTARNDSTEQEVPHPAINTSNAPKPAPVVAPSPRRLATAEAPKVSDLPSDANARTAIYDIAAHTVYLPDGHKLEAHSGLGTHMDDPRFANVKDRGPTPPNVYALALREHPFHGVRAIRLIPVGGGKMFGRAGMLAHSYMLGPNGDSNGCVSFDNYPAFLNAFLRGEVDRLVVVEHLAAAPGSKTGSGWLAEMIKDLFERS